jgi:diaminopimelate epimerase
MIVLTKHHALGNDFLVVFDPPDPDLPALTRRLCDRRRGIGADGLLVGTEERPNTATMVLYNADGSRALMSGNGVRCFAQALAARRGHRGPFRITTDSGLRVVEITPTEDPATVLGSGDMGEIRPLEPPPGWAAVGVLPDRPVAHLDVGNPHTVVAVEDVNAVDLVALGRQVPSVNLEIVEPGPESNAVTMRVHERGAGVTDACGSGAVAAAWAAAGWALASGEELLVHMDGGSARVALHVPVPGHATLTGPATYVARIEIPVP